MGMIMDKEIPWFARMKLTEAERVANREILIFVNSRKM